MSAQPGEASCSGIVSKAGTWDTQNADKNSVQGTLFTVNATHSHNLTINNVGSNTKHNNIQPYITAYIWRRTA